MKQIKTITAFIAIVAITLNTNSAFGQATQAVNNITAGSYLGTSNANDVVLKAGTSGTQYGVLLQNGNWGLGSTATAPASLLSVGGNGNSLYKIFGYNGSNSDGAQGIRGEVATPTFGGGKAYATVGVVTSGQGYAFGVQGASTKATTSLSGRAYGVYGIASNATAGYNYGVYGILSGTNSGAAIYGTESGDVDVSAITQTCNGGKYAGYFNGDLFVSGCAEKTGSAVWTNPSDKRLKKDIVSFTDGLNVIRQINPVTYKYNNLVATLDDGNSYIGVLAQDVQPVAPYCVKAGFAKIKQSESQTFSGDIVETLPADSGGIVRVMVNTYGYDANGLIYALVNSVKQLDSTVTALQNKLGGQRLGGNDGSGKNMQDVKLTLPDAPTLGEPQPNPNNGSTQIPYYLPQNIGEAKIIFTDMLGKAMEEKTLQTGYGLLNIDTQELPNGIYSYSLVVAGKVIETKKMIKNK